MSSTRFSAEEKLAELSKDKAQLLKLLLEEKSRHGRKIRRFPRERAMLVQLPTSWAQQRLWFIDQLEGRSEAYHINVALRLRGQLNEPALRQALDTIVKRHEALRTVFVNVDGDPKQEIAADGKFRLQLIDLSGYDPDARAAQVERHTREESRASFDLRAGPLIRGRLLRLDAGEHLLLVTMHHIISDGWSMGVFMHELAQSYCAEDEGRDDPLDALPIQYADYALWQREWLHGAVRERQLGYWQERLQGAPAQLELPTDRPRPAVQSFRGQNLEVAFDAELTAELRDLAQRHDVTLFMVLYAGWTILLSRLSGAEDVVVGTPVANRQQTELEPLIGFFVNTLALRATVERALPLEQYLKRVKALTLEAYQHQDIPFEHVVEALQPERSLSRNPIFQVMFALQTAPKGELQLSGLVTTLETEIYEFSMFDLMLSLEERSDQIVGALNYATDLFDRDTAERWMRSFVELLREMTGDARRELGELSILTPDDRSLVVDRFNATSAEYPTGKLVHELFEEQVARTPQAPAVEHEEHSLTYADLNAQANQLAHYLRQHGVGRDQPVAICLPRGFDMVVGLLAILKAGGAYVPLDPNYPRERLQRMLEDSAPTVLLTSRQLRELLPDTSTQVVDVAAVQPDIAGRSVDNPGAEGMTAENLVYVIFTSGSTGRPKGTAMSHGAMANLIEWHRHTLPGEGQRVLQFAALSFDVAFQETFTTLCTGGTLVLLDEWVRRDARVLAEFLAARSVDRAFLPPLMLQSLAEHTQSLRGAGHELRDIICAGEQLRITPEITRFFQRARDCRLHNHYGPTETHVVTALQLSGDPVDWPALPTIGRPIANTQIYIVDERRQPLPVGVTGEVYIGGAGVAREYLGQPELTSERFVRDPFSHQASSRLYRTGDLGRWKADGTIEYLGRNDDQVKIRGFRIELGEIETKLLQHPSVREGAVVARESGPGEKRLVAYIVPADPGTNVPTSDALRTHLKALLPEHMVPSAFVVLQKLPLTPTGKLDRRALPSPELDAFATQDYVPPSGEREEKVADIWKQLLSLERVGRHDNFFVLGGHSLLIVQMLERLRRVGLLADVRSVYSRPTLAELAHTLVIDAGQRFEVPSNLIPQDAEAIEPGMLPLVELESEHIERIVQAVPGGAANVQDIYPLAPLQEGMLFHHLLNEQGGDTYIVPTLVSLPSGQQLQDFVRALQHVIDRHDILRTAVMWEQLPRPVQVVQRRAVLHVEQLAPETGRDALEQLKERMRPEHQRLDLRQAPMMRLQVLEDRARDQWHALLQMHHLVCDHESLDVTVMEVIAHLQGQAHALPRPTPYRDHVAQALAHAQAHDAEAFFRSKLGEIDEPTAPFGLLNVHGDGTRLEQAHESLDADLAASLRDQARRLSVSAATLFHAVWALVVSRTSGRDDVVFGTVLLGRLQGSAGAQRTLGMFINTLPIRLALNETTARELVERTQRELVELLQHEQASLAVAQRCSGIVSKAPLFTALLNYRHSAVDLDTELGSSGVTLHSIQSVTNYPIVFSVDDRGAEFVLDIVTDWRIDPHRVMSYVRTTIRALVEALENALPTPVIELPILPDVARRQLIDEFNATQVDYPSHKLLHELFEEQVERAKDVPAVVYAGKSLSFGELNARANQLARQLQRHGVGPEQLVGLCVERGIDLVVGILAILKAGAAYVPLDPDYPSQRLQGMLQEATPRVVLTQGGVRGRLPGGAYEVITIDDQWSEIEQNAADNIDARSIGVRSHHLAYVIFTSGSTGLPKGVMIEHRSVVNLWHGLQALYSEVGVADRVAVNASYAFDASVKQFIQLLSGRTLYIVPQDYRLDAAMMLAYVAEHRIQGIDCTPSQLKAWISAGLLTHGPGELRMVLVGGEPIDPALWQSLSQYPEIAFYNVYGPTECTVDATVARVSPEFPEPTIGRVLMNMRVYLLNRHKHLVPMGVAGEMYIGGAGVARGYFNQPQLTKERFGPDLFNTDPRLRLYKTGDLARWRADGTLEYLGRNDDQVKIRGYRIELGDIEAQLAKCPELKQARVIAREDIAGDKRLVAYVIPEGLPGAPSRPNVEELRARLKTVLPEHMVPSAFVVLEGWPLTPSGKLDHRALPTPEAGAYAIRRYELPQGEIEEILASIWQDLLGVDQVGRHDNFFELGGHSLLIVQVMARLRRVGVLAKVRSIYDSSSLMDLAKILARGGVEEFVAPPNGVPRDSVAITPQMLPLVELEPVHIETIVRAVPGGAANIQDIYPLAPLQEGMLFHHLLSERGGDTYVRPILLSLPSRQRLDQFVGALQQVIDRHDILRTAVMWEHLPRPVQVVHRRAVLSLQVIALDPLRDPLDQFKEWMQPEHQYLDLRHAPMMGLQAAEHPRTGEWYALLQLHHLASDHESTDIMLAELMDCLEGRGQELPEPMPYRNHVAYALEHVRTRDAEAFFRSKLADVDEPTAPFGVLNVHHNGSRLHEAEERVDPGLAKRVRTQARRMAVSAATLFHAANALVMARTSGRDDVVFGSVLLGRLQGSAGAQRTLGMFMNTLPLRVKLQGVSAKQLVEQTQRELVELLNHEQASLAVAQRCSGIPGSGPLFTTLMNYRHSAIDIEPKFADAGVHFLAFQTWTNFPIMMAVDDYGEAFTLSAKVDLGIDPRRLIGYLRTAIESLVEALELTPQTSALDLAVMPASERREVIESFNQTQVSYPEGALIHELIEEQAQRWPQAVAVRWLGATLTYQELGHQSNQLAHYLRSHGVRRGDRVGLCLERSSNLVVGILGVLKSGAAYIPLDASAPRERLEYLLEDAAPAVILTQEKLRSQLPLTGAQVVCLDTQWSAVTTEDCHPLDRGDLTSEDLVYVMYTSGSTGRPKGVMVRHRNIVNYAAHAARQFDVEGGEGSLIGTSMSFDLSLTGLYPALICGRAVNLCGEEEDLSQAILAGRHSSPVKLTPTHLTLLSLPERQVEGAVHSLVIGGEPLHGALLQWWRKHSPRTRIFNHYGPTEATVGCVVYEVTQDIDGPVPIGKPISNVKVYILDARQLPVPIGVVGEIFVAGEGVAGGYWNRPELTAERFVRDPFGVDSRARMYKTGDLGRWRADGNIELLGRNDHQVKIRGFRVELGEIEAQLRLLEDVGEAVVLAREDALGDKRLVAYVTRRRDDSNPEVEQLRAHVKSALPDYMLPSAFVILDRLPVTSNGKLDRAALPAPELGAYLTREYAAPVGEIEEKLAEIWKQLLRMERVGRHDNFFELGGHSLHGLRLIAGVADVLGVSLSPVTVFRYPTVGEMAEFIAQARDEKAASPASEAQLVRDVL